MKIFCGFDLGTRFGYAVIAEDGSLVTYGQWKTEKSSDTYYGERLIRLRGYLIGLLNQHVDLELVIAYENVNFMHSGVRAAHVYGMFLGVLEVLSAEYGVPLMPLGVSAIKKFATGSGKAKKPEMHDAAKSRWQIETATTDECDALWIAEYARMLPRGE